MKEQDLVIVINQLTQINNRLFENNMYQAGVYLAEYRAELIFRLAELEKEKEK